jgi:hypothetical protein
MELRLRGRFRQHRALETAPVYAVRRQRMDLQVQYF